MFWNKNQTVEVLCNESTFLSFADSCSRGLGGAVFSSKETEELKQQISSCLHFTQINTRLCTWVLLDFALGTHHRALILHCLGKSEAGRNVNCLMREKRTSS